MEGIVSVTNVDEKPKYYTANSISEQWDTLPSPRSINVSDDNNYWTWHRIAAQTGMDWFFFVLLFRSIPSKPVTQMFRRIKIYIVLKGERPNTYTYIPLSNHSVPNTSLTLNNNNINSMSI